MHTITLYTTAGCHLCKQAEDMLRQAGQNSTIAWRSSDIADDPVLVERYGIRIPVIMRAEDGAELGWPFDQRQLEKFLRIN